MALTENVARRRYVLWLRRGLRFHDNPALLKALSGKGEFYPIYIFDGETSGVSKDSGFNRVRFLLKSLQDLDEQLRAYNGKLHFIKGEPSSVFEALHKQKSLELVCFEQDPEPIWALRDNKVKTVLRQQGVEWVEEISHTLWNPLDVIKANGGVPPLTYQMFLHTVSVLGCPPRPVDNPDWNSVQFGDLPTNLGDGIQVFECVPTAEQLGYFPPQFSNEQIIQWIGGERMALSKMQERLEVEKRAFSNGYYLPNQDMFTQICSGFGQLNQNITGQLIWREFFYTMSAMNPFYGEMKRNPICLDLPWKEDDNLSKMWENGCTGYPFIDAAMRQLQQEGWIHHVARNAVACFLTRGDLWLSWEVGFQLFLRLLVDADWSLCAGNWMWVSSSAFEQLLDCSACICPVSYGRRLDPKGEYVRRYIPELRNFPEEYLYEPWEAPLEVQERAGCYIGKQYPERIVDHRTVSIKNKRIMESFRLSLVSDTPHCCPSDVEEVRQFMCLPNSCVDHLCFDQNC